MAIDFGTGIRALQAYGEEASRDQAMRLNEQRGQQQAYAFNQGVRQDQARPGLIAQARGGDYRGAQDAALGGGDDDLAKMIGGLRDDQLAEFQHQADVVGNLVPQLKGLPPEQRARVGSSVLAQAGFTPQQLQSMDWSDEGLEMQYQLSAAGKAALAARTKAAEPYTLSPGAMRMSGDHVIADNPAMEKPIWDAESGSLIYPSQFAPGGGSMPQTAAPPRMGGGGPLSAMTAITAQSESGNRDYAPNGRLITSPKGAQGAMQTMPMTQRDPGFGVSPVRDGSVEEKNRVGREYLSAMSERYGDPAKAWAAYNAGPGRVDAAIAKAGDNWLSALPRETQNYVAKNIRQLQSEAPGAERPGVVNVRPPRQKQGNAPSGYRFSGDSLEPIPGGPADPKTATNRNVQSNRKAEADLRNKFDAQPEVKTFKTARQQFNTLRGLASKPNPTGSDDLAIIFNFMKTLDPSSVVREGEFQQAANSAGLIEAVGNKFERAENGRWLSPQQRRNMVRTAYQNYKNYRDAYNQTAEQYRGYASDYSVSPDRVARTYTPDKPAAKPATSQFSGFKIERH